MKHRKRTMRGLCLDAAVAIGLAGCGSKNLLDSGNPVSLTKWHYYNGSRQAVNK